MNAALETAIDPTQRTDYILKRATETLGLVASPGLFQPEMALLFLNRLMKRYGETIAVNELSLTLERGEVFGLLGPNGAGKTTTISVLCGLIRPTAGHGTILGYDIWRDRIHVRPLLGYVPQQFSLYPDLTVLENLWFFASAYRVPLCEANCRSKLYSQSWTFLEYDKDGRANSPVDSSNCSRSVARSCTSLPS